MKFNELVPSAASIQGIASVYGMIEGSYIGFSDLHYAQIIADRVTDQPYVVAVGTMSSNPACVGRVLNVVKLSGEACLLDAQRMPLHHWTALKARWPSAVVLSDVYLIDETPDFLHDLKIDRSKIHVSKGLNCTDIATIQKLYDALCVTNLMKVPVPPANIGLDVSERTIELSRLQ